jgi:ribose transport system substrate-binding protein
MRFRRRSLGGAPLGPSRATTALAAVAAATLIAACSSAQAAGQTTIGVDLTYNSTAFWAAYINYETQYAQQLHIHLLGPLLAAANASLQNTQIENLVNEGAKAIIVNPETATSLGPAISYAAAHHVQLISVDTIVGVGKVYMVVRASNLIYGLDACAYISSKVKSGYVLDLEGDLTSSNGADRTNAFDSCMAANDPGVHILKDPTVWTEATAVTDAQNAVNGEGIIFAVFAAAVIGGVSLQGGRGNMVGAASGVVLLGVVQNILDLENAPNYWIDAIDGGVILVALILARVIGGEASAE